MAVKVTLKKRRALDHILVPIDTIVPLVEKDDKENLMNFFTGLAKQEWVVHDRRWLEHIINWVPEGGQPLTKAAMWFKLAARVAELDPEKEGGFTFSKFQADLIWTRLNNPQFVVDRVPQAFRDFILDFQEASGMKFPEEEEDDKPA